MEKEAAYKDAADHYQKAWAYGNKNQPSIGNNKKLFFFLYRITNLLIKNVKNIILIYLIVI